MVVRDGLHRSVTAVRELFGAAASSCALVTDDGGSLRFLAADGAGAEEIVGVELPLGRGLAGWAAMSGQALAVRDVGGDARFARDVAEATGYVPAVILVSPFFDGEGEVLGVLEVLDPSVDLGGDWPLAVLGTLAMQLAEVVRLGSGTQAADDRFSRLGRQVAELVRETLP